MQLESEVAGVSGSEKSRSFLIDNLYAIWIWCVFILALGLLIRRLLLPAWLLPFSGNPILLPAFALFATGLLSIPPLALVGVFHLARGKMQAREFAVKFLPPILLGLLGLVLGLIPR